MGKDESSRFFNRELSWVEFNARVLSEAQKRDNPLLERLKFAAIVSSNFDEFFMVRVATLKRQLKSGSPGNCPTGMSPAEQLRRIGERVNEVVGEQTRCLVEDILPGLAESGALMVRSGSYSDEQVGFVQDLFQREVLPVLTPVRVDRKDVRFTGMSNLRLHVGFLLKAKETSRFLRPEEPDEDQDADDLLALVQIPDGLDRFVWLPERDGRSCFTLLEDIVVHSAPQLFPGYSIREYAFFRITRDADLSVDEGLDEDFVMAMEEVLVDRQHSTPVRLEVSTHSTRLREILVGSVGLEEPDVYDVDGPMDLKRFVELVSLPGYKELRYEPWRPCSSPVVSGDDLWEVLERTDVLLHHPYESFDTVVRFISEAAVDPDVLAVKMTLYRTSGSSPIVKALARAAENGKQVTVLVELKARFDEERNIGWANWLEKQGVIVIYGIARLKVHAKALLVVRREPDGIKRYLHLGTGNYNDSTARLYTDIGLMTSRDDFSFEAAQFFNGITGYSAVPDLRKLVIAPVTMKDRILTLIRREESRCAPDNPGLIMAKVNSLADPDVIEALYAASRAGVRILLNVRGICMLRPGVKGMSENIEVVSIVGRFLEHSRVFYFHNGGSEEVYLSSADWMPRNLEKRVELMFPVEQGDLRQRVVDILETFFRDNQNASVLQSSGGYRRKRPGKGEPAFAAQVHFYEEACKRSKSSGISPKRELEVRRRSPRGTPLH